MPFRQIATGAVVALGAGLLSACGSTSSSTAPSAASGPQTATSSSQSASSSAAGGAAGAPGTLSAEARATATGDIPDNQVFLTYRDPKAGYLISFPEGWAQRGAAGSVVFQDKNNVIRVVVTKAPSPSPAAVAAGLASERQRQPSLTYGAASTVSIQGSPVVKIHYATISPPNPVTGKRIQLLVDRYVYAHAGKVAIVDLATPVGVDNVDAYRMISRSLRWL